MLTKSKQFFLKSFNPIAGISATIIFATAFFLSGCQQVSVPQVQSAPSSAPIVLADGIRTSYADIVDRAAPAVVKIQADHHRKADEKSDEPDEFPGFPNLPMPKGQRSPLERGLGSGVIINADGTILTNNHVVEGAEKVKVELADKRTFEAKIVGTDAPSDLAVLKIQAENLPTVTFGDSDKVRVGDVVLAIGNPLGIGQTVTSGIISAKGRSTGIGTGSSFEDFLQTDAPINRGNSGGALVSMNGELIGINSQILSSGGNGGNIGIGFAIPSNMAKSVMEQLLSKGKVSRGQLGIVIQPVTTEMAQALKLPDASGVIVSDIRDGSAADKAGIKRGDVIIELNGEKISDGNTLRNKVAATKPNEAVNMKILRDGKELELKANLDEFSADNEKSLRPNPLKQDEPEKAEAQKEESLGLEVQSLTSEIAKKLNLPANTKGLVVVSVEDGGAAEDGGIAENDVISEANRQPLETAYDLKKAVSESSGSVLLLVQRSGRSIFITVQPKKQ